MERYVVIVAAILFFSVFGAISLFDRSHGDIGESLDGQLVNTNVEIDQAIIEDPALPEGLLILGAGQGATLKFEVENNDPDNDIDTIEVGIPGSEILNGSYEWYTASEHDWTFEITDDSIKFEAVDDFTGSVTGGSSQYDVAGNIDDALDHIDDTSEAITLAVDITVTSTVGMKMDNEAMDLKVGDLKTEDTGSELETIDPFPFPYIVAENGSSYLVITIEGIGTDLEIMRGTEQLFSPTRSGNFMTSDHGFKYNVTDAKTVVILDNSDDTIQVTPLVTAKEDGLSGTYTLNMFNFTVDDIITGSISSESIVSGYVDDIPSLTSQIMDTDIDDDGILNKLDDDMDGDGILNVDDQFPKIFNRIPVVTDITEDASIVEGEALTLTVTAEDPDPMDTLTYMWAHDQDSAWNETTSTVTLTGLDPGTYVFTVGITDTLGNVETETVTITITENQSPSITSVTADKETIEVGEDVILTAVASDTEGDAMVYTWTHDQDTAFSQTGSEITVSDLEKGTYVFTVTVSDDFSDSTSTIEITVKEKDSEFPIIIPIIVIAVILALIIAVVVFILMKKGNKDDEPELEDTSDEQAEVYSEVEEESTMEYPQETYEEVTEPVVQPQYEQTAVEDTTVADVAPPVDGSTVLEPEEAPEDPCPECGAALSETDTKCPGCGVEFDLNFECPVCGEEVPQGSTSCALCGTDF